ncbi:HNH endonuclease signature motif containing protein [Erythrobacter litoralis]|uniref:HNH endonuclease signature motif containing protein n=1 Tax=Erythrobacter litoralis TaxID=39960 RepID=UPI002435A5E5|nr:HNH endonuclease signature motif containing protein [Erythrobacter litoralis]
MCLAEGRRRQATVVDHVVPLEWSQCDERWNKQGACDPCHDGKSKRERAEGRPCDATIDRQLAEVKRAFEAAAQGGRVDL